MPRSLSQQIANRIVFLSVPESLRGKIDALPHHHHNEDGEDEFSIDPAIPLPVEIPEGEKKFDPEQLSWEMILSGMIRVIAEDPEAENAAYYRRFVLAVRPDIFGEFSGAAVIKAANGEFDMALDILAGLEGLFPGSPEVLLNRALTLEEKARKEGADAPYADDLYDEAEKAWEKVLALHPPLSGGLFSAGFFFMDRRNFEKAKECFHDYIPLAADEEKKQKAERILKEIEQGGLEDESFREAYELIRNGNEQEGLIKIRDFLERYPGVWNGWFVLGWGLRQLGRWEDGAAAFRKALELGGDRADTRNELAICLTEMGDLKAARRELETALRSDPESVKIISNLGALAHKNGDDDEALGFFRTVLELDPDDPVALDFLSHY